MNFAELGLSAPFLQAVEKSGYKTATPIQAEAIPIVLQGHDLIGCAHTGTGKTAAFTLPMLDRLISTLPEHLKSMRSGKNSKRRARVTRGLVLSPTRELTVQIGNSLERYGGFTALRNCVIYGGVSQVHQVKALQHGVDIIVATPGRLLDLMEQGHVDLSGIEILVFDEADQMLDMGFLPSLKRIVKELPETRQTLMFSATMPPAIRELAQKWLNKPAAVQVAQLEKPTDRIQQSVHLVDKHRKSDLLAHFLLATPRGRTLVFSRTKHGADKLVKRLKQEGVRSAAIHGNKTQGARSRVLEQFKGSNPPVLVATDVAARGLDINDVSHVINFDLPEVPETYVHRIGRTARAGASGIAVSFCTGDEHRLLRQIERLTKTAIPVEPTVVGFEVTEVFRDEAPQSTGRRRGGYRSGPRKGPSKQRSFRDASSRTTATKNPVGASKHSAKKKRRTTKLAN